MEEYRDQVVESGELDGAATRLSTLTSITVEAAYSRRDPTDDEAVEATAAAAETLDALRSKAGLVNRLKGIYLRR